MSNFNHNSDVLMPEQAATLTPTLEKEYAVYLRKYTDNFTEDDHYLIVGTPKVSQGWKLHLTVISPSIRSFLDEVIPVLLSYKIPFKLIKSHDLHEGVNAGDHGNSKVGKIITLLLDDEAIIAELVKKLKKITDAYEGPQVATDFYISRNMYARYGSFTSLVEIDPFGNHKRIMQDPQGHYIQDQYKLPPTVPAGVSNPFIGIADPAPEYADKRIIGNKYILLKALKLDLKGNVYKALHFRNHVIPTFCIVKEGRKGVFPDLHNRDVRARLRAQRDAYEKLGENVPTPAVIDLIEEQDVSYLVTKYITGAANLNFYLVGKMKRIPWQYQSAEIKEELLGLLEQMAILLGKLHSMHVIHRDFTDNNLMITRQKKLWAIDNELLWSVRDQKPDPPFGTGTPGFMSPEQENGDLPRRSDDTYSFGGMIALFLSGGIEPAHIVDSNLALLRSRLVFLSGSEPLSDLACQCLHPDPESRPEATVIVNSLQRSRSLELAQQNKKKASKVSKEEMEETIQRSINTIGSEFMTHDHLWHIPIKQDENWDVYPLGNRHIYSNLHQGVSGVVYGLSVLKTAGFNIEATNTNVNKSFEFVIQDIDRRMNTMSSSLYYGKAGLALMIGQLMSSLMMEKHPYYQELIGKLLGEPARESNVIYGVAGQGIAMLRCRDVLEPGSWEQILQNHVALLISRQLKNGGWHKIADVPDNDMPTGFGYGVSGIVYFLLKYGEVANDSNAIQSALRGLNLLEKSKQKKDDYLQWPIDKSSKEHGAWWCAGSPGIALSFLKAYDLTADGKYLEIAEKALRIHNKNFAYHKLGQCHGIAGLGEIYLEAFNTTGSEEWQDRARWIAELLYQFRKETSDEKTYWFSDKFNQPSANFMTGDTGILHFLARFINPGKLSFPIIA